MRVDKCSFCACPVYPGHGTMFVRNDSKTFRFCSSKCDKAFKKKKNPRRTAWTKAFRRANGKEMASDSTFAFERRRNVPIKTDKNLIASAIRAIERVEEIKARRQEAFYKKRVTVAQIKNDTDADIRQLRMHSDMLPKEMRAQAERVVAEADERRAEARRQSKARVSVTVEQDPEAMDADLPAEKTASKQRATKALRTQQAERIAK